MPWPSVSGLLLPSPLELELDLLSGFPMLHAREWRRPECVGCHSTPLERPERWEAPCRDGSNSLPDRWWYKRHRRLQYKACSATWSCRSEWTRPADWEARRHLFRYYWPRSF